MLILNVFIARLVLAVRPSTVTDNLRGKGGFYTTLGCGIRTGELKINNKIFLRGIGT